MNQSYTYITLLFNPLITLGYVNKDGVYCISHDNITILRSQIGFFNADRYIHEHFPCKYMIIIWHGTCNPYIIKEWDNKENKFEINHDKIVEYSPHS